MRKASLIILGILLLSFTLKKKQKQEVNILFVGNGLTSYHSMPETLQKMLAEKDEKFKVYSSTFFELSLNKHFTRKSIPQGEGTRSEPLKPGEISSTEQMLISRNWDHVVLQDFSLPDFTDYTKPSFIGPEVNDILEIKKNPQAKVNEYVLFKIWPNNKPFPKKYSPSILLNSLDDEIKLINTFNDSISKIAGLSTVPITNCFAEIKKNYRNINLYDGPYYPSEYGTYLIACIFFKHFSKLEASKINYMADLDTSVVRVIQKVVDKQIP